MFVNNQVFGAPKQPTRGTKQPTQAPLATNSPIWREFSHQKPELVALTSSSARPQYAPLLPQDARRQTRVGCRLNRRGNREMSGSPRESCNATAIANFISSPPDSVEFSLETRQRGRTTLTSRPLSRKADRLLCESNTAPELICARIYATSVLSGWISDLGLVANAPCGPLVVSNEH